MDLRPVGNAYCWIVLGKPDTDVSLDVIVIGYSAALGFVAIALLKLLIKMSGGGREDRL